MAIVRGCTQFFEEQIFHGQRIVAHGVVKRVLLCDQKGGVVLTIG